VPQRPHSVPESSVARGRSTSCRGPVASRTTAWARAYADASGSHDSSDKTQLPTTADIYAHFTPAMGARAAARMDAIFTRRSG
jgi:hypothetical protein